jgi:hypothetical protein
MNKESATSDPVELVQRVIDAIRGSYKARAAAERLVLERG